MCYYNRVPSRDIFYDENIGLNYQDGAEKMVKKILKKFKKCVDKELSGWYHE
ncbi:MAG: hypothetical protein IJH12_08615 [Clostridia bacterium]|nr:hypothetical protein [Clostridia bacterium]